MALKRRPAVTAVDLDRLSRRGHRGGAILPHRSLDSLRLPAQRLLGGTALALTLTLLLLWARPWIEAAWSGELGWWLQALEIPARFDTSAASTAATGVLGLNVPHVELQPAVQSALVPWMHAVIVAALWWIAGWFADAARPGSYLLRFACIVHGASVLCFALWPGSFPHSMASHTVDGLRQIWGLMLLTPWLHLGTYYLFPLRWWQRPALSLLSLLFLFVLAPLQYALHAALLHHVGIIMMPLLHLVFGVMVPIVGFVALYGWGMSWAPPDPYARRN